MNWDYIPLKRLSVFGPQYGANAKAVEPTDDGHRYVRITDIDDKGQLQPGGLKHADLEDFSQYILEEGDLLFARSGATVGKTYLYRKEAGPCIFAGYLIRFHLNTGVALPTYVYHYTHSPAYLNWVESKKRVAAQPNINGVEYGSLSIPVPPLFEQQRIVEILDQADALRKKRTEADAKAERILPALFYKMFGDPVTNPKRIVKKKLGDLIKVKSGNFLPAKDMNTKGEYPVYGGNGINGYHSEFMFEKPVIVLGRVGMYCGSVHYSKPKCWVTDNALYVSKFSEKLHDLYLSEALKVANLNQYAGRAGQPLISGNRIYPVEILVPPLRWQKQFTALILRISHLVSERRITEERINLLFNVLLYHAFSGNLTSKWRKEHMKELLAEMKQQQNVLESSSELN